MLLSTRRNLPVSVVLILAEYNRITPSGSIRGYNFNHSRHTAFTYIVAQSKAIVTAHLNRTFLNGWSMLLGGLVTLSIHFAYGSPYPIVWDTASVGALLYLTLVGSALAFGIYFWMLQHTEATTVPFVTVISPVIAVFIGAIVLSESLTGLQIAGSIFVLSGVLLSEVVSAKRSKNTLT